MWKKIVKEFSSIRDFEKYIMETPLNSVFRWERLYSSNPQIGMCQEKSFDEALDKLKHGWDDMSQKLEKRIQIESREFVVKQKNRMQYDVAGYQASVPRYLQGVPQSMINSKKVPQKQKVITIVKHIGYLSNVSIEEIIENSVKALMIVKKIEAQGYRVNLDVISPAEKGDEQVVCKVRIKSANERLNISKVAFPLVNPDMLRRMVFRFREVHPEIKNKKWAGSYGSTIQDRDEVRSFLKPTDYYLSNFIGDIDKEIANMKLK